MLERLLSVQALLRWLPADHEHRTVLIVTEKNQILSVGFFHFLLCGRKNHLYLSGLLLGNTQEGDHFGCESQIIVKWYDTEMLH